MWGSEAVIAGALEKDLECKATAREVDLFVASRRVKRRGLSAMQCAGYVVVHRRFVPLVVVPDCICLLQEWQWIAN